MNDKSYTFIVKRVVSDSELNDSTSNNSIYSFEDDKIYVKMSDDTYAEEYRNAVRWDFGDGTYVEGIDATHYYKNPGKYIISCTLYKSDKTPKELVHTFEILVKEIFPTKLEIENPADSDKVETENTDNSDKLTVSKANCLFKLKCYLSANVVTKPTVIANRVFSDISDEKSYFEIKDKPFYHLERYYTFLEKHTRINHYDKSNVKTVLTPVEKYKVQYVPVYGYLEKVYDETEQDFKIEVRKYTEDKNFNDEKNDSAKVIGYFGIIEIWYKNDNLSQNDLYFYYNQNELKFENESATSDFYLNIPPLGVSYTTVTTNEELEEFVSLNGIVIDDDSHEGNVEKYLANSLYKDKKSIFYHAKYIKNGNDTYSLYKQGTVYPIGPKYTTCENDDIDYYKKYSILSTEDEVVFNDNITFNFKDLNNLILPSEKMNVEDINTLLECYMPHPLFFEKDNVKSFLKNILDQGDFLNYITTKGLHFFDDNVNIKTCYLEKLISTLEMFGEDVKYYDNTSFNNCNELRDLTRILSMNYCDLFGRKYKGFYDIQIKGDSKGKNVGEEIKLNDSLYCDISYNIVGIKRNGEYYKINQPTSKIIVRDDFNGSTRLVSLEQIPCYSFDKNCPNNWGVEHIFTLEEYDTNWNWNLVLPQEFNNANNREKMLHDYYSFYLLKPNDSETRYNNFLDENTIPEKEELEEWDKPFGFKHDCLIKVLSDKLLD